ncbi:hypothetical protein [Cereibacter sphaeroides]|uniref:hypothetical protein n=1 Tax=Cereibacter sphaeroides TaxID=1063 RepID=UPI003FCD012B
MLKPDEEIRILMPRVLADEARALARRYDVTLGSIIRKAVADFVRTQDCTTSGQALEPKPRAASSAMSERELDELRSSVSAAVSGATSWASLRDRLAALNLEMVPKGGGLALRTMDTQKEICKASEAGFGYSQLIRRFGEGLPGHPHHWLVERILGEDLIED